MANLVEFTASTVHAAATNTKTALENKGHTVTLVADSAIGSTDVSSYDAMVAVRCNNSSTVAADLRTKFDAGKPLAIGLVDAGTTAGFVNPNTVNMALTDICWMQGNVSNTGRNIDITNISHPITDWTSLGNLQVLTGDNFKAAVYPGSFYPGVELGVGPSTDSTSGYTQLMAAERGSPDIDANPLPARLVIWGNLYGGQTAYTANGETLLDKIIAWVIAPPGRGLVLGSLTLN